MPSLSSTFSNVWLGDPSSASTSAVVVAPMLRLTMVFSVASPPSFEMNSRMTEEVDVYA